jgi:hypothetical protein
MLPMKGCEKSYLVAPKLGWMELRASSSRVAVTVMPSDGSAAGADGDCGSVWP